MNVSLFKKVTDVNNPYDKPILYALNRIKNGSSKLTVEQIRISNTEQQKILKKQLPGVCFNGTFKTRSIAGIKERSGFIILDFDKFENQQSVIDFKNQLKENAYVYAAWISPSAVGLKVLVKIPTDNNFKGYFDALKIEFDHPNWDNSVSNLDRFCYESYDPDIFINENSIIWNKIIEPEITEIGITNPIIAIKSDNRIITNLLTWWEKKYGFVQGQKNNNLFILASSFNTFGISQTECSHVFSKYEDGNNNKEIEALIKSAYKKTSDFGTRFFEDKSTQTAIEKQIKSGKKEAEIITQFPDITESEIVKIINQIKENLTIDNYWTYNEQGACKLSPHQFKFYLQQQNFFKYFPTDSNTYTFIKKEGKVIEETNEKRIKDFVLGELLARTDIGFKPYDMMASSTKFFTSDFLSYLESADVEMKEDTSELCYLYFNNCAVEISKDNINTIDYFDISGYIWKKQLIGRNYIKHDHHDSEFRTFLWLVSGKDVSKYNSFKSVIGYLLHSYKTSANNKAIIFNDETISDNPNGGSGKGLFWNALSKMKKVASIDGKTFEFTKSFAYQTVSTDTQILVFDDVKKNFNFESLFSVITEGITLEYKNQDAIKIPVSKSPKIIITTNYTIGGVGGSFERRKFEVEMADYFSSQHTPFDEFGHMLFDDWSDTEWAKFDNFMMNCVQYYLKNGLVKHDFNNLEVRKFIKETSFEFYEWSAENLKPNQLYPKEELYNNFLNEYSDFKKWLTKKRFHMWLIVYANYHKYIAQESKIGNNKQIEFWTKSPF